MKRSEIVRVRVSEVEAKMFEELEKKNGAGKSELIREWLRRAHKTAFPYVPAVKAPKPLAPEEPELSPEQLCEQAGGRVETVNGVRMCVLKISPALTRKVPLSKPELFRG